VDNIFGAVTIWRRLYQDREGDYHFLLDEYLEWEAYQAATPSLGEAAVSLAAVTSFREAAAILEKVTASAIAKVRELLINGELSQWCGRQVARGSLMQKPPVAVRARTRKQRDQGEWLQAGVPAPTESEQTRQRRGHLLTLMHCATIPIEEKKPHG
jgi:hypothetical protein